jgi:orotidine-5'-phosphate decarboxylase
LKGESVVDLDPKQRIIVALDVSTLKEAKNLVRTLAPHVGLFKVGLELLTAQGAPRAVKAVQSLGGEVFYDGKFNDIPNTTAGAVRAVIAMGVYMYNVHVSAGKKAIEAAIESKGAHPSSKPFLLGVTVLTSIDEEESVSIFGARPGAKVLQFAHMLKDVGADGIICSPQELEFLTKDRSLKEMIKVTPGVRPIWAAAGDQKRFMTPGEAIRAGADYVVIGRPITKPPAEIGAPANAAQLIAQEIAQAQSS